jgi:[protein-PII] uridylyltransferase
MPRHLYWRVDGKAAGREGAPRARRRRLAGDVYLPDQKELFARICGFLGRPRSVDSRSKSHTTRHGYALDTFVVHDPANPNAGYRETIQLDRVRAARGC